MGLAKPSELNHYPGPAHVLALSSEMGLTAEQKMRAEAVFLDMERQAKALGEQIVDRDGTSIDCSPTGK